ncbi:MAG TPA: ribonuclease P protein component [Chitinophagaceae bacterium]|nr:ribonuclease P protein component [Chitinophagaceae bacterium]
MTTPFTLGKQERLKSRKDLEALFREGQSFFLFPYKVIYRLVPGTPGLRFGTGAGRRHFRRATDRNRIKRLTREAFRLQKGELLGHLQSAGHQLHLFLLYTGKELPEFSQVKEKTAVALKRLSELVHEMATSTS